MDPFVYLVRKPLGQTSAAAVGCFLLLFFCFFRCSLLTWLPPPTLGAVRSIQSSNVHFFLLVFVLVGVRIG